MGATTGPLTEDLLDQLTKIDTPTIANALELMEIRPRTEGFMRPEIRSISTVTETHIGYAVTGVISARHKSPNALERRDYYEAIEAIPTPRMVVLHDLDTRQLLVLTGVKFKEILPWASGVSGP